MSTSASGQSPTTPPSAPSPKAPRTMRQALAILLTLTGGLALGSAAATTAEAAMSDPSLLAAPPTPLTSTASLPGAPLSFEQRASKARRQLMVATADDQDKVEGVAVRRGCGGWDNCGWRNWGNWNNWQNWRNWNNWSNWRNCNHNHW